MKILKYTIALCLYLIAFIANASTQTVETSLGRFLITKKGLKDQGVWVIKNNSKVIKEIEDFSVYFLSIAPSSDQDIPIAKIDTGDTVSLFVNVDAGGSGTGFGEPFVLFIKKSGVIKTLNIDNAFDGIEKIEISGNQALIHVNGLKSPLRYENGTFHNLPVPVESPKIETNKSTPIFEADNEKPVDLSGKISIAKEGGYSLALDSPIIVKVGDCGENCLEPHKDLDVYDWQKEDLIKSMLGKHVTVRGQLFAPHAGVSFGDIESINER